MRGELIIVPNSVLITKFLIIDFIDMAIRQLFVQKNFEKLRSPLRPLEGGYQEKKYLTAYDPTFFLINQ